MRNNIIELPSGTKAIFNPANGKYKFDDDGISDLYKLEEPRVQARPSLRKKAGKVKTITLITTDNCNLRCSFCYMATGNVLNYNNKLSAEDAIKGIDMLTGGDYSGFTLSFMGGEPTMNLELMVAMVEKFKPLGVGMSMTTNGTRFGISMEPYIGEDISLLEWCYLNNIGISLSLEGPKEIHDQERSYASGKSSYEDILKPIIKLKGKYPNKHSSISARATLEQGADNLLERVVFFDRLVTLGIIREGKVEADTTPTGSAYKDRLLSTKILEQYSKAAEWFINGVKTHQKPHWSDMTSLIQRIIGHYGQYAFCGAGNTYMTINAKGGIEACHRLGVSDLGSVSDGIDEEQRLLWSDNRSARMDKCGSCKLLRICGGGCRALSMLGKDPDITKTAQLDCDVKYGRIKTAFHIINELGEDTLTKLYFSK